MKYLEAYRKYIKDGLRFIPPLFDANGHCLPVTHRLFRTGEHVVVKNTTFRVAYVNDGVVVLEPIKSLLIENAPEEK